MSAVRERPPQGRYGRSADAVADRRLRVLGAVLGALALVAVGLGGWWYVTGESVSGDVVSYTVVSDTEVRARIQVYKDADRAVVCTLRSQSVDRTEVGRRDVTVDARGGTVDAVVTLRTTARATDVELVGCTAVGAG